MEKLGEFAIELLKDERPIGYLNRDDADWAVLSDDPLNLEHYMYAGATYYRVGADDSRYMSISNQAYVGCYNWQGATTFQLQGGNLVSDRNGQKLSLYSQDNRYLFCWDQYSVLGVKFVDPA